MPPAALPELFHLGDRTSRITGEHLATELAGLDGGRRKSKRRDTSKLKLVPRRRNNVRRCAPSVATSPPSLISRARLLGELEAISRRTLEEVGLAEGYVGWLMVVLASEFWEAQVAAVPMKRRLFLLPHCLKHAEGCPADYDDYGLDCRKCGACSIADFRAKAEDLGYKVLVAEGSPIVLKIIVSGHVDAICGVACLNVLEKAIDKILLAGIPCMAVPVLSSDCRNTSVDEDWVMQMVQHQQAAGDANQVVRSPDADRRGTVRTTELERLVPRLRGGPRLAEVNGQGVSALDPVAARGHCLRFSRQRREALAAVHHAGRARRADRRQRLRRRRRRASQNGPRLRQAGRHVDRDVSQSVARA